MLEKGSDGKVKILVVEDDYLFNHTLCYNLKIAGYTVDAALTKAAAEKMCKEQEYDLIVLDINLPDGNGLEFLEQIRKKSEIPVILLTANDTEIDVVMGLENGADDYITKPFSLAILRARVGAQLRRKKGFDSHIVYIDLFSFDFEKMEFRKGNRLIELSKTEQKLLRLFIENQNVTLTRDFLVDRIWTDGAEYVDENALSVVVKRLRDKLDAGGYIKTVYGLGYIWKNEKT